MSDVFSPPAHAYVPGIPCLKKTVQSYFRQNFVKFQLSVKIFGAKMAKRISLCEGHSFLPCDALRCTVFVS